MAVGSVALLAVAVVGLDLYSRVEADATTGRMAVTMGEYVSRETDPEADQISALGDFLHRYVLGVPGSVVYVVSLVQQIDKDDPPQVVWVDTVPFGEDAAALAGACGRFGAEGGAASLPAGFTLRKGEVIVVSEVCARLSREGSLTGRFVAGDLYALHVLPIREQGEVPAKPVRDVAEAET